MQRPTIPATHLTTPTPRPAYVVTPKSSSRRQVRPCSHPTVTAAASSEQQATWDPDGILPPAAGGHFARRERERAAQAQQQPASEARPHGGPYQQPEGVLAADDSLYDKAAYAKLLTDKFMPVDLDFPGLRIVHFDPPVLTVDAFFTPDQCDAMVTAAEGTGRMATSKIGAGNASDPAAIAAAAAAATAYSNRRTSTSLLLDTKVTATFPQLSTAGQQLQAQTQRLLPTPGKVWGRSGRLPSPGQFCFESLQVARYDEGQHFLAHEDAFPTDLAVQNGFQRRATLLVYLNDVAEGGATAFDEFHVAVRPVKGKALLFFPAFSDGSPDSRTLHTAQDAVDVKWVTQQWVACGMRAASVGSGGSSGGVKVVSGKEEAGGLSMEDLAVLKKKAKKGGAGRKAAAKGFGGR